jgi:hypothetical protein
MSDLVEVTAIYNGSNGDATKALYQRLERLGPIGIVAVNLFRACKSSERAKVYRGGGYRGMAYDRKSWSLNNLCAILDIHSEALGIAWGWSIDEKAVGFEHVLYADIPTGQVSFHNGARLTGPDYGKPWDGVRGASAGRICRWIAALLAQQEAA